MDTPSVPTSQKVSWRNFIGYGIGHVLNDVCASMWFTYLLVYFHLVLGFSSAEAGVVLLVGQIADAVATPFVGFHSDKTDDWWLCRYGRRKTWHLLGTLCTAFAFPFIFSPCVGCTNSHAWAQLFYYCAFVCIFQFGWAAVQISHLALIPELSADEHDRTKLAAIRYSFTVFSSLLVYAVTWGLLKSALPEPDVGPKNTTMFLNDDVSALDNNFMAMSSGLTSGKILFDSKNNVSEEVGKQVGPDDAIKFQEIVLIGLSFGALCSVLFHILVREKNQTVLERSEAGTGSRSTRHLLKDYKTYQVAGMYMCTRLFVNLTQVFTPLYLHETLKMSAGQLALIPLVMFISSLLTSPLIHVLNKCFGRKMAYSIGAVLGIAACIWARFGNGDLYITYIIYVVAVLFGCAGSILLVTSLGVTSDFIGKDTDSGALVYGLMSFTDKLSNGFAVIVIQNLESKFAGVTFYRDVLTYVCGSSVLLGVIFLAFFKLRHSTPPYESLLDSRTNIHEEINSNQNRDMNASQN
uniref:Putative na+/melibiose symporter n=1 Tax=Xenopsylla cheopis TaxID=163159 RepID=A0A6M2DN77_XENCH